jgi:catechol 2,3-dioxygenase-like lactoylglutathione lyase family enzyme
VPIASRPDHVAIAVPSIDDALARWQGDLGGVIQWRFHTPTVFHGAAVMFASGAYLEMLMPSDATERTRMAGGPSGFVDAFLDRFGPRVHHVTLKVQDINEALATLEAEGFTPRDVNLDNPSWQEAFLRPSQIGGLIVQIASSDRSNEDWAAMNGHELPGRPAAGGPGLLGPQLVHDDLDRARTVWTALGGDVTDDGDGLLVSWPGEPLTVAIALGDAPAAIGVRFTNLPDESSLPADPAFGPPAFAR